MSVLIEKSIVAQTIQYLVYGEIEEFDDYKELFKSLEQASKQDTIIIKLNSPGGRVDVGLMICNAFKQSSASVRVEVVYPCYSMGALIALSGDQLILNPHTFLMFHDYSGKLSGKGNEQEKSSSEYNKVWRKQLSEICYPFLTKKEVNSILNGMDIYIHHDDPNISRRLKQHF